MFCWFCSLNTMILCSTDARFFCALMKEGNVLFNDALNTFYLWLYGVIHMGYSFRLAAKVLLYASSYRQDNTYHGICYTSRGALARTRNSTLMKYISYFIFPITKGSVNALMKLAGFSTSNKVKNHWFIISKW